MSVVVAGAAATGLMQLSAPVASAAPIPQAPAAVSLDTSYDLSYFIAPSVWMSPAVFFNQVRRDFVRVFPIPGAAPLTLGANMNLRPVPLALFNVRVAALATNGWTFGTRLGHPDFPGTITFRFIKVGTIMYLKVHGSIPLASAGGVCMINIICRQIYVSKASATWSGFAKNLTRLWTTSWGVA